MKRSNRRVVSEKATPITVRRSDLQFLFAIAVVTFSFFTLAREGMMVGHFVALSSIDTPVADGRLSFVGIAGLIILNAAFVASSASIETLRSIHVRHVRETNAGQADRLQELIDHRVRYVTACTMASRLMRFGLVLLVLLLAQSLALRAEALLGWEFTYLSILGCALGLAVPIALVDLVFGELVPKSYASINAHIVALRLYKIIRFSALVLWIPALALVSVANLLANRFGGKATLINTNVAEEEIKTLVESAEVTGEIESDERELLHSVFEFNDTVAREIMTPRVDLDAMPIRSDPKAVIALIQETGHTRIPLYEDTDDQILGIIHAKDLLMAMVDGGRVNLRKLLRPAVFVPEGKKLHELLAEMRQSKTQMAVVQDEFGGTAGIVTIEDIVEELVGDIVDEYDNEAPDIVADGVAWLVLGRSHLDDINDLLGSEFESDEFDTVGGFVFGHFGRQPRLEESIEIDGYRFTVVSTDGRRVHQLRLEKVEEEALNVVED